MDQRITFITLAVPPITIAHNLATPDAVDGVLEQARSADAAQVIRWEICHNPGPIGAKVLP